MVKRFDLEMGTDTSLQARYMNERLSLEFLASLGDPPVAPLPFGADDEMRLIVMEDLGDPPTLVQPLVGSDPDAARTALRSFAACLGDQHARTSGRHADFDPSHEATTMKTAPSLDVIDPSPLGLTLTPIVRSELEDVSVALAEPGGFSAFIHGDPCPDNCFRDGDRYRFIDFEFGAFGYALLDGVYWHTQFPTCWCASRVGDALSDELEGVYRDAFAEGCPLARVDSEFDRAVVRACAARTFGFLHPKWSGWLSQDRPWGLAGIRARVPTRLRSFATQAERRGLYPASAAFARTVANAVDERFSPGDLPLYPALRAG